MTANDQTTPVDRAAELIQRGPAPVLISGRSSPRSLLRRVVLRTIHPFAHHQREVVGEIVGALRQQEAELTHVAERHSEQIKRLEDLARDLILAIEQLRKVASNTPQEHPMGGSDADRSDSPRTSAPPSGAASQ